MISLEKKEKPLILIDKEESWKQELMTFVRDNKPIPKSVSNKYSHPEIKSKLLEETNHKCAYCESKITAIDYGDIEHIEPKKKVPQKTFEWNNLTIACGKCNQNKGEYYNPHLSLINPYIENPEEEFVFLGPYISPRTPRAEITVKQLKLDRVELYERRTSYIDMIQPLINLYLRTKDLELKKLTFHDLLNYTKSNMEYSAMMKSVLSTIKRPEEVNAG